MRRSLIARCFFCSAILSAIFLSSCVSPTLTPDPTVLPTLTPTATPLPSTSPSPPARSLTSAPTSAPTASRTPTLPLTPTTEVASAITPTPTKTPLPSGRSQRIDTKFRSALLGKDMPILIYLPPGYPESGRRYPTLYMLHGYGGPYTEWEKLGLITQVDRMIRDGRIQPMIVVMPEGERSWWFNHAHVIDSDGKPWGDYVWKDVVGYIDLNYQTLTKPESRAIGGLSSGGQSAFMLGMTHPEVFKVVGMHSPSFRGADGSMPIFGDANYFKQYDPIWLVQNTDTARRLTIGIDVGEDDDVWGPMDIEFNAMLDSLKIPHDWRSWAGRHRETYWSAHIPDYLAWYSSKLVGQ